jgi:hypothetical protein
MSDLKDHFLFFVQSSSNWDGLKEREGQEGDDLHGFYHVKVA